MGFYVETPAVQFHGKFDWDTITLQKSIKLNKPDYKALDPRTWPLFDQRLFVSQKPDRESRLPSGVAYSNRSATIFIRYNKTSAEELHTNEVKHKSNTVRRSIGVFFAIPTTTPRMDLRVNSLSFRKLSSSTGWTSSTAPTGLQRCRNPEQV